VWQLLSGSMHKMEANVGYYWSLKGKDDATAQAEHIARDEIDKVGFGFSVFVGVKLFSLFFCFSSFLLSTFYVASLFF
jgi:hypothetical protein